MEGHAPANPLRRSLPGEARVKPERNLGAAKPPSAKGDTNLRPLPAQVTEPPYADPHVRWCGRGGAARLPPIPITPRARALRPNPPEALRTIGNTLLEYVARVGNRAGAPSLHDARGGRQMSKNPQTL